MDTRSASKTIGGIFMNDAADDEVGIRGTTGGGNLLYTTNDTFRWFGSGILNKPIGDFHFRRPDENHFPFDSQSDPSNRPYFMNAPGWSVRINLYRHVIPEPAEYALVFGLFALAFVIVRRRFRSTGR